LADVMAMAMTVAVVLVVVAVSFVVVTAVAMLSSGRYFSFRQHLLLYGTVSVRQCHI
jgi:hypothetical protein